MDERIDVCSAESLRHWSEKLCASEDELRRAVDQVGPDVHAVKKHLFGAFTDGGPSS